MNEILDVGSGHNPYKLATVLVDLFLTDDSHRDGFELIRPPDVELICASAEYLPFKKDAFRFVNCTSVIEHIDAPELAVNELKRVGKKGFISFPRALNELFFRRSWECHKNVLNSNGKVLFRQNKDSFRGLRKIRDIVWSGKFRIRLRERLGFKQRSKFIEQRIVWK